MTMSLAMIEQNQKSQKSGMIDHENKKVFGIKNKFQSKHSSSKSTAMAKQFSELRSSR